MKTTVLDASAVVALFFEEPGAETVERLFHLAAEAEVIGRLAEAGFGENRRGGRP